MNDEWYCCEGNLLDYIASFWPDKGYKKWRFSHAWSVAKNQYEYIKNNLSSGSYDIYNLDDIPYYANNCGIQIGDVMYLQWDRPYPHHATIISKIENGMIYYTAHTSPRKDEALANFFRNNSGGSAHILKIRE